MMEFGATHRFKHILLTGPPGIGKTTVCKKIIQLIEEGNYMHDGFYTEEVRSADGRRMGFDVVSLSQTKNRAHLARNEGALGGREPSKFRVGNYSVFIDKFELVALPCMESRTEILIIDEIGKMELLSKRFYDCVEKVFWDNVENKPSCIIATIPKKNRVPQRYSKLFEKFYKDPDCQIVDVNVQNRNQLPVMLIEKIIDIVRIHQM